MNYSDFRKILKFNQIYLLILGSIAISGCTSSNFDWDKNREYYKVYLSKEFEFSGYEIISIRDYKGNYYYVLTKELSPYEKPPFDKYGLIHPGGFYKLTLNKIDSIVTMHGHGRPDIIYLDNEILWSFDTVRVTLYSSPNLYGRYIKIEK